MEKYIWPRGSGKTTALIKLAHEEGYILVEPIATVADFARRMAKETGYDDVKVIDGYEFCKRKTLPIYNEKYLIDELDWFLEILRVVGYSNTINQQE